MEGQLEQFFYEKFISNLETGRVRLKEMWNSDQKWTSSEWTKKVTDAAQKATLDSLDALNAGDKQVAAKGHSDIHGYSEYLTIDVTGYDEATWSHPIIAVEHENSVCIDKIKYCAWKLLSVRAKLRVLICYIDPSRKYINAPEKFEDLEIDKIVKDNPNTSFSVILGHWNNDPLKSESWKEVYKLKTLSDICQTM